tara:strand:+ start:48167 stop:49918 length:1752 start_codon:yes stop_codon:yes gene_type:complete
MQFHIHQTHHQVADFKKIFSDLKQDMQNASEDKKLGVHIYPELYLTGYPLQDLCLQKPFINSYQKYLEDLNQFTKKLKGDFLFLIGGLEYELTESGLPLKIKNVIFQVEPGKELKAIYTKRLLPNYDIFDEQKYFTQGEESCVINYQDHKLALLICEDMWSSSFHNIDPVKDLFETCKGEKISAVINLSASPYYIDKPAKRSQRAQFIAKLFHCPFIYCNRVGSEDEIIFDGASFITNEKEHLLTCHAWKADSQSLEIPQSDSPIDEELLPSPPNTWEELFSARIDSDKLSLNELSETTCHEIINALAFGVQEYAQKSGFKKFTIALSGGMDSALVLSIVALSLKEGQSLEAIYMPSQFSSPLSYDLSYELCQNLKINLRTLPIKFLHSSSKNLFESTYDEAFEGLTDENIQSRLRGMLLYTRSNQIGSMVVNTSNKSELAVGYSTQYGDSVGAISLLGDLYKSQVYQLANYINSKFNKLIPEGIITRPPSAELREDQKDTDSLPPYERLDSILEGLLTYRYTKNDLIKMGFETEEVNRVFDLYRKSEFKRYQFCPILKISSKSFGFGYRIPMSKASQFYLDE